MITISGAKAKGRNFVYFTDVKNIPNTDLATIERLWNKFSKGKFGYSVQKVRWLFVRFTKRLDGGPPLTPCIVVRKNGDRARATLKPFAEKLDGPPQMEKSRGRSVGLVLPSLSMMSKRLQRDTCLSRVR